MKSVKSFITTVLLDHSFFFSVLCPSAYSWKHLTLEVGWSRNYTSGRKNLKQTGQNKINSFPQADLVTCSKPRGSSFSFPLKLPNTLCFIKDTKLLHQRQSTFCSCEKISLVHWWYHTYLIKFPRAVNWPFPIQSLWSAKALCAVIKSLWTHWRHLIQS